MQSKRSEKAGSGGADSKMFLVWKEGTQEMEVCGEEGDEERRSGTKMRSMGESEETLWGEGTASKRGGHKHRGMNDEVGSHNACRIQRV